MLPVVCLSPVLQPFGPKQKWGPASFTVHWCVYNLGSSRLSSNLSKLKGGLSGWPRALESQTTPTPLLTNTHIDTSKVRGRSSALNFTTSADETTRPRGLLIEKGFCVRGPCVLGRRVLFQAPDTRWPLEPLDSP